MRSARVLWILVAVCATGCGDGPFGDERTGPGGGTGNTSGAGTGGTGNASGSGGAPTFEGDCDAGPLATPIPNCAPEPLESTGDPAQDCVDRINQLRWECQCLPPLERWTAGESCADEHAEYDSTRDPHAGFRDGICPNGGWAQNECPGWGSIDQTITGCLQAMWDEGPGPWGPDHGHYINMTNPDYSSVACGFFETPGGEVWAIQNFQ